MAASVSEINDRIAILRSNIVRLIEEGDVVSGAESEELIASRLAEQNAELERLASERDELEKPVVE